ncbi:hypothetical protein COO60DRAFT_1520562 [Scenedesmus sp. NREL 46B-D3]|nr:hypothetical protein COO60DRAFT_1520562 [Scenedesmus sp. NREL 46B-D3]
MGFFVPCATYGSWSHHALLVILLGPLLLLASKRQGLWACSARERNVTIIVPSSYHACLPSACMVFAVTSCCAVVRHMPSIMLSTSQYTSFCRQRLLVHVHYRHLEGVLLRLPFLSVRGDTRAIASAAPWLLTCGVAV